MCTVSICHVVSSSLAAAKTSGGTIESGGGWGWHWAGQLRDAHTTQGVLPRTDNRLVSSSPPPAALSCDRSSSLGHQIISSEVEHFT